jgi:hypothetical protein
LTRWGEDKKGPLADASPVLVHECVVHLRPHEERKGVDMIESVLIRRVMATSVMPPGEQRLRFWGREAAAVAALAGGHRLGEGLLTGRVSGGVEDWV